MEISSREQLFELLKNPLTKSSTKKTCPYCQENLYPVHSKGRVIWMGCLCKTARPYSKKFLK